MFDLLIQIVFGWPFIILSLLVSLICLITNRYWLLLIGAVLFAPFSYYLNGAPGIRWKDFAGLGADLARFSRKRMDGFSGFIAIGLSF